MAEDIGAPVQLRMKQSIARVEMFTDASRKPEDRYLTVHFEDGLYDASDALVGVTKFGTRTVNRRFGDIAGEVVEIPGVSVTIEQLAQLIAIASYRFRQIDIANEAVQAAEREAAQAAEAERLRQHQAGWPA